MKKHIPTLAIAMAASILVACGGDTPTTGGGVTSSNVTLSGVINTGSTSTAASTDGGIKKLPTNAYGPTATGDLTGFKLYCVTFTDPPLSGTGELTENADGSYGYSVTLTDAAGLPIGCFLNDPANKPVSTVTFNVTDSTSLNSSSSGAALSGGTHEVTINYDPVTGTSTAAITTAVLDTTTPTTDPSTIASQISGSWKMGCDDPAPVGVAVGDPLSQAQYDALSPCQQSFNIDYQWDQATGIETMHWNGAAGGMPLYLNVVSGTQDGTAVNAMGVWPDKTTFDGCGSTEAMSQTALTAHNVSVTGQTGSTSTSAVGNFIGVHDALVTAGAYVVNVDPATGDATASGSLVDIKNALATTDTSLVYNSTFNDQWFTDANGVYDPTYDYCDTTTDALGNFAQNTVLGQQETQCYTQFLQNQYHQWPKPASLACAPDLDLNSVWQQTNWDQTLNNGAGGYPDMSNIILPYRTTLGGISPRLDGTRYALMGLDILAGSAVATDHSEDKWSYDAWDDATGTSTPVTCNWVSDMTLTLIPAADGQTALGRFNIKNYSGCYNSDTGAVVVDEYNTAQDSYQTIEVNFTKQ